MRLFSYKMTHDSGFAPNPFGPTLTLATCKPEIRRCKRKGDWIAGFTSAGLCGDKVGAERLVYLMRVGEKLHLRDYFDDPRFKSKVPTASGGSRQSRCGDNIYKPLGPDATEPTQFEQLKNENHWGKCGPDRDHLIRDVNGQYVLVADEFYYFGKSSLFLPAQVRPEVPRAQSAHAS